jgi:para-nitrobenzyl esterase
MGEGFYPQVDGDVLPRHPLEVFAEGDANPAPVLLGTVPHEWAVVQLYGGSEVPHPRSLLALWFYLGVFFGDGTGDVIERYAPLGTEDTEADAILERVMSDMMFHCPARAFARQASTAGTHVYLYSFELEPAVHGLDVDYLFGVPWVSPLMQPPVYAVGAPLPLNAGLVNELQGYAARFMDTGDPNGAGKMPWPRYARDSDRHLVLGAEAQPGRGLYEEVCDFWDGWHERWNRHPTE